MKTIVGVKFKKPGKMYYFDPQDLWKQLLGMNMAK